MNSTGKYWQLSGHLNIPPIAIKQWSAGIEYRTYFIT